MPDPSVVVQLESGYISAAKPNYPGSGLPGRYIVMTFLPMMKDIEECKRQAQLWACESQTKNFTYRYGPQAVIPPKFL